MDTARIRPYVEELRKPLLDIMAGIRWQAKPGQDLPGVASPVLLGWSAFHPPAFAATISGKRM